MRCTMVRGFIGVLAFALSGACTDTPSSPAGDDSIEIAEDVVRLRPGGARTLTLSADPGSVAWSVRDPEIATVDATGTLHGRAPGMTWVFGAIGVASDSARVVVSFVDDAGDAVQFSVGGTSGTMTMGGLARVFRTFPDHPFTLIAAFVDPGEGSSIGPAFFPQGDTTLVMHLAGEPGTGFHEIDPWIVTRGADDRIYIDGREGAFLWVPIPDRPGFSELYVPVTPLQIEIDATSVPDEVGIETGHLRGRVGFDAAGLLIETREDGRRIVGQVSPDLVSFFAEFDLAQRLEPIGRGRLTVTGGPAVLPTVQLNSVRAGLWRNGLVVNTGYTGHYAANVTAGSQLWVSAPGVGNHAISELRLEELIDGSAYDPGRTWGWTETGAVGELSPGPLPNLGLSSSGTLRITRYDPPGTESWGLLEATLETEEYMAFGGEPGDRQTVTIDVSTAVAPAGIVHAFSIPRIAGDVGPDDGPHGNRSIVRIGSGDHGVYGRVAEMLERVADVEVTLTWEDGSATAITNEIGHFWFLGAEPGSYRVSFEVPEGHTLADGQDTEIGPFEVPGSPPHQPVFVPIDLADAAGNGTLVLRAATGEPGGTANGLTARVRQMGSESIVTTLVTGSTDLGDGRADSRLQPGRYEIDLEPPSGYRLANGQTGTVEVEITRGGIAFVEVFLAEN